jgi:predicted RNA binding protein YcfA (HicA-like mRNA interferase family)
MKIRRLKTILRRRGYRMRPGKGSHSIWTHPDQPEKPVVLHGAGSDDAAPYQVARVCKGQKQYRSASLIPHQETARSSSRKE